MGNSKEAERFVNSLFAQRENFVERASWILEHRPTGGYFTPGAQEGVISFEDSQICYVCGVYSGSIVLGQSAIENMVCGYAYSMGEVDDRPSYYDAVEFLKDNDMLSPNEVEGVPLDELNNIRNPLTHFRPPFDESRLSSRSVKETPEGTGGFAASYLVLKADAERVLKTMFSVMELFETGSNL